jgi:hypothetical protein
MMQAEDIDGKHPIIIDFIKSRDDVDGCGYFRGNQEAIQYAQAVSKRQKRKFRRYGIIPKALISMIGQYFVFSKKKAPIYRDITYEEFITMLIRGPYKNEESRQIGEKLYHDLLCAKMPRLERSFFMMDESYRVLEN